MGVIWGFGLLSLEILIIDAMGGFTFGGFALHGARLVYYGIAWAFNFVLVGINEEFTFRGYPQLTLTDGMGFWPAAVLLSALFGFAHLFNPNEGWVGALSVFLFGMFACLTLKRTGNLWFAIGVHAAGDYSETFIYSVPDSGYLATGHLISSTLRPGPRWLTGGSIGPEGSVFAFLLLGCAFLLFAWLYPSPPSKLAQSPSAPQ
jgi:membrane protease YdiL (CAAX protease family)